jgi:outer membrane protein assembly factor BamB
MGAPRGTPQQAWAWPNADRAGTRAAVGTTIGSRTVRRLEVAWRFRVRGEGGYFGLLSTTPLISKGTAYVQDTRSSVYAIDLVTGARRWARHFAAPNDGPNGLALVGDRLYGATDTTGFALDAATGRRLWATRLTSPIEQFVNIAPVVDRGRVYLSTVGFPPGGRGAIYGLDAHTGRKLWKFDTIERPWPNPTAGGGGAWQPMSVDAAGRVYAGIANPGPWGGTKKLPNGGVFRGSTRYTDSLVVLDGATGKLEWFDQVLPHDVRDYDFHLTPILVRAGGRDLVIGSGKGGFVHAWDRATRQRLWTRSVGTHRNDRGPLPSTPVVVCPGLFGGPLTPMASAQGRVFVPVVELCMHESSVKSHSVLQRPPEEGTGVIVALDAGVGSKLWARPLPSAPFGCATVASDVVFAPTYDGRIYALSAKTGAILWSDRARAGINGCPSVSGDTLLVPAGAPHRGFARPVPELIAYRVAKS